MKVVVVGASGLIGSRIVRALERTGQEVVEASRETGVNSFTGEGLGHALEGADVLIDVTNSGPFGEGDALDFFKQSGKNLLIAARSLKVKHYMALSVLGVDRLVENDYFRAKMVQENLILSSGLPYTIVRSAQLFDFFNSVVNAYAVDGIIRLPSLILQPLAVDDAADWMAKIAVGSAHNSTIELAGPEESQLIDLARELLTASADPRPVEIDPFATYFGVELAPNGLIPNRKILSGQLTFHDWLAGTAYA